MHRRSVEAADLHRFTPQHRTGVQAFLHLHDRDAGIAVAGEDRRLDRRRPPPARQQAPVDVEAPASRRTQHGFGQDQAVGGHHGRVQGQGGEANVLVRHMPELGRRPHRQSEPLRFQLHR